MALTVLIATIAVASSVTVAEAKNIRSQKVKNAFAKINHCPSTGLPSASCPGYVIDDIVPLDCGGKDVVSNKQWQTVEEADEKDKWERNGPECKHRTHGVKA